MNSLLLVVSSVFLTTSVFAQGVLQVPQEVSYLNVEYENQDYMTNLGITELNKSGYGFIKSECFSIYITPDNVHSVYSDTYAKQLIDEGWIKFFSLSCSRNMDDNIYCNHSSDCIGSLDSIDIREDGSFRRIAG